MPMFDEGKHSFALQLGVARPTKTNGLDSFAKPGPGVGLQYLYYPWDWVAVGGELDYLAFGKKSSASGASGSATGLYFGPVARVNILRERSWTPYVLGGAGLHSFSLKTASPAGAAVPPADCRLLPEACGSQSAKSTGLALTGALGLEAFLFRGFSLSFEARYHEFRLDSKKFAGNAEGLSYMLGIHVWLKDY